MASESVINVNKHDVWLCGLRQCSAHRSAAAARLKFRTDTAYRAAGPHTPHPRQSSVERHQMRMTANCEVVMEAEDARARTVQRRSLWLARARSSWETGKPLLSCLLLDVCNPHLLCRKLVYTHTHTHTHFPKLQRTNAT